MQLYCIFSVHLCSGLEDNRRMAPRILQLLAGLHQCIKTADVPGPPGRRAQKAQGVGFDFHVEQVVSDTGN